MACRLPLPLASPVADIANRSQCSFALSPCMAQTPSSHRAVPQVALRVKPSCCDGEKRRVETEEYQTVVRMGKPKMAFKLCNAQVLHAPGLGCRQTSSSQGDSPRHLLSLFPVPAHGLPLVILAGAWELGSHCSRGDFAQSLAALSPGPGGASQHRHGQPSLQLPVWSQPATGSVPPHIRPEPGRAAPAGISCRGNALCSEPTRWKCHLEEHGS